MISCLIAAAKTLVQYYNDLITLVNSKEVRTKLKLRRTKCLTLLAMPKPENNILETLEESFEFLDSRFKNIEIVGSGTPSGSWDDGIKMDPENEDRTIWQKSIKLTDGKIKFREDEKWTFNWGAGELDLGKLIFGGPNIPVRAGEYNIVIDIEKGTYQLNPI